MSIPTSVLAELLKALPNLRPQMYFKSSLIALSHAMEDRVLAGSDSPLAIASFQRERFYRQEAHRYRRIAEKTDRVYILSAPETDFKSHSGVYETIAFDPTDAIAQEWHLVIVGEEYANCLICRERSTPVGDPSSSAMDNNRRFEGIWTFDRAVSCKAAEILLDRILHYRPELAEKIEQTQTKYCQILAPQTIRPEVFDHAAHPDPFVQRLVTYLQASQYKLLKAYRSIAAQEQKERLIHLMTVAIRESLDPEEVLDVAVEQLGQALGACRCLLYRCRETDRTATIRHEFLGAGVPSVKGQTWPLQDNPLFQAVLERKESIFVSDTLDDLRMTNFAQSSVLQELVQTVGLSSWLVVPVFYKNRLQGIIELHHCGTTHEEWTKEEISLIETIATQVGVALIQAEAYANLEDLNQQLEALDRTRYNLVAITGHELRTPLSTIQVCLESLASEPDMPQELQQVMLNAALSDAERMRKLIQDFLTLSQLESGRVEWNPEALSIQECLDLSLSNTLARKVKEDVPQIVVPVTSNLPLVQADGEWLVEVLAKLLDNACKFTDSDGRVSVDVETNGRGLLKVTVADTGRGIEPNRLETVFDRFYQEEGALQRTTGGTGLGLAICRQIIRRWGGEIWAESEGKNKGSQFHFTIPIVESLPKQKKEPAAKIPSARSRKGKAKR
ncbi:DICT sensory domain-containing protein [Lusitaniella coriacea]|uniref:DICT sensory domain-containing protein n=1 Tax=Lusitaniella coriacea TaxID=1983105 RepID=UPI003CF1E8E6